MNPNPPRREWFFPIEEAPVLVTVTHKGSARDVRVPHKKALVAADTGDIVGIVGAGYKVFTNQQAVSLCYNDGDASLQQPALENLVDPFARTCEYAGDHPLA